MVERHTIETYGPQPNNRNIWSSRLADSFVWRGDSLYTTTSIIVVVVVLRLRDTDKVNRYGYEKDVTPKRISAVLRHRPARPGPRAPAEQGAPLSQKYIFLIWCKTANSFFVGSPITSCNN